MIAKISEQVSRIETADEILKGSVKDELIILFWTGQVVNLITVALLIWWMFLK